MNILMLCGELPYPPHGGSRMRVYQFVQAIALRHPLTLLAYQYEGDDDTHIESLRNLCRVEVVSWQEPVLLAQLRSAHRIPAGLAQARTLLLDRTPYVAQYFQSANMACRLYALLEHERFDLLHVEDSAMMALLPKRPTIPVVLSIQNVEWWRQSRSGMRGLTQRIELARLRRFEQRAFRRAAVCCPTSALEAEEVRRLMPSARIRVIANGVDSLVFTPGSQAGEPPAIVFTGTLSYEPNATAVRWFAREVWPLIQAAVPEAHWIIAGREPPDEVCALASERIAVTGEIPDMLPILRRAWLAVVPVRSGGGTRLKVLEAMACGLPVVSTAIGAEGLDLVAGRDILIADEPDAFAAQVVRLLHDDLLRHTLGRAGRAAVEERYDWRTITQQLLGVYELACRK